METRKTKQHSVTTEAGEEDRESLVECGVRGNSSCGDAALSLAHVHKQTQIYSSHSAVHSLTQSEGLSASRKLNLRLP